MLNFEMMLMVGQMTPEERATRGKWVEEWVTYMKNNPEAWQRFYKLMEEAREAHRRNDDPVFKIQLAANAMAEIEGKAQERLEASAPKPSFIKSLFHKLRK